MIGHSSEKKGLIDSSGESGRAGEEKVKKFDLLSPLLLLDTRVYDWLLFFVAPIAFSW